MQILISNDDGVNSPGLQALVEAMEEVGQVTVVAPDRERSAIGHSLTFFHPLRVHKVREGKRSIVYSSDGTPTDCVLLGIYDLMPERPRLVISGINRGANLGDDITYSGTVSAAIEGLIHGCQSIAVSLAAFEDLHWSTAAHVAHRVAESVLRYGLPPKTFLNVNVPNVPLDQLEGYAATFQGESIYDQRLIKRTDPRGVEYYWITGAIPRGQPLPGSDFAAVLANRVSITPMQLNMTNRSFVDDLRHWDFEPPE